MNWRPLLGGLLRAPYYYRSGVEAQAHMPVLTALREQIAQSIADVEASVGSVCDGFAGMADRAGQAVARASRVVGGGQPEKGANVEVLLGTSRTTIEHLMARMERGGELSLEAVKHMQEVEVALRNVIRAVAEINSIAFRSKLLALNAKIESAHVGERGNGFGLVADEITSQAERSNELTAEIESAVGKLRSSIEIVAGRLRQSVMEDRKRIDEARSEVQTTLDALESAHNGMRESLEESAEFSRGLATDIHQAVVAMQFQDRLSQRMGHVIDAIGEMEEALRKAQPDCRLMEHRQEEATKKMHSAFTMAEERAAAGVAASGVQAFGEPSAAPGDVELF